MTDIKTKLTASAPYASFEAEKVVTRYFSDAGWDATQGLYYDDLETNKKRELDVIARRTWVKKTRTSRQVSRVTALVEVKSMKGFHLLLSKHKAEKEDFYQYIHCAGDPSGKYAKIVLALQELGVTQKEIGELVKKMNAFAYPRGAMLGSSALCLEEVGFRPWLGCLTTKPSREAAST